MFKARYLGVVILFSGLFQITGNAYAQMETTGSIVEGVVYEDSNGNLIRDEGEPGLPAVSLEFSDGAERLTIIETGEDGSFVVELDAGLWRILMQPLSGFEVVDATMLEVLIADENVSMEIDIAMRRVEVLENDPQEDGQEDAPVENDGDDVGSDSGESEEQLDDADDESADTWGDDTQQDSDESQGDDDGFYILPESGGNMPSKWNGMLVSAGLFVASFVLVLIGRRLIVASSRRR